jgi:hypothetical protein
MRMAPGGSAEVQRERWAPTLARSRPRLHLATTSGPYCTSESAQPQFSIEKRRAQRPDRPCLRAGDATVQARIFTARAATRATVMSATSACPAINNFASTLSGMVSVGLKAVELVNDTYR